LVYQHPSISELVTYCLSTTTTKKDVAVEVEVDKITDMRKMLLQFSCDFPPSQASTTGLLPTIEGKVVLLTGSTGGLGSHLLELLASHPSVHKIYALNRTGRVGTTVESRQRLAFTERGIDTQLLHGDKVVLLEGDLTKATLGLDEPIVAEV
jgi:FlaA1/EpsC-like NDP-sugar epimerase